MKEKLTLTIEKETKKRVKRRAKAEGRSVSAIVEDLLNAAHSPTEEEIQRQQQIAEAGMDDYAENLEPWRVEKQTQEEPIDPTPGSFYDKHQDSCGMFEGPRDLSSNPKKCMKGFGK